MQAYQKSLFLVGHISDGTPLHDEELRLSFLPSLTSGARRLDEVPSFTPLLNYVSDGEIDRNEKEREKEMNRRRKRNTRGKRGVLLPDREPIRTYRTPAIGFPELDPAAQALAAAANAPVSRRAAAAAASHTIANMIASENGERVVPQSMPAAPQQAAAPPPKPKQIKGLFKAPSVPQEVYSARATVETPIMSTASGLGRIPLPAENENSALGSGMALDRNPRIHSARRAKELEREAKEKEFADGQHPNYIDGVWHCSNCGCPESIAIGRRKGPLGDKSQCGTCGKICQFSQSNAKCLFYFLGKFWHRHRRPRPVEYNTREDFHRNVKSSADIAKSVAKKKGGAAALRAQAASARPSSEPQTPRLKDVEVVPPSDDRLSPVSTASSHSEPPLSHKKPNGTSKPHSSAAPLSSVKSPASVPTEEVNNVITSPPNSSSHSKV